MLSKGCSSLSFFKSVSAGGQLEQPSEVKSSTMTGCLGETESVLEAEERIGQREVAKREASRARRKTNANGSDLARTNCLQQKIRGAVSTKVTGTKGQCGKGNAARGKRRENPRPTLRVQGWDTRTCSGHEVSVT